MTRSSRVRKESKMFPFVNESGKRDLNFGKRMKQYWYDALEMAETDEQRAHVEKSSIQAYYLCSLDGKTADVLVDDNLINTNSWEIAGVGDYDGDGKDDLLLRELSTGWGGLTYWKSGVSSDRVYMDVRIETSREDGHSGDFAIVDTKVKK